MKDVQIHQLRLQQQFNTADKVTEPDYVISVYGCTTNKKQP